MFGTSTRPNLQLKARAELELRRRRRDLPPVVLWAPHPDNLPQNEAFNSQAWETLYGGSAGGGKMLAFDTPIPTPAGWKLNGDLRDGDWVLGANGVPVRIVKAHAVSYPETAYRLTFDDGSEIEAGGEHKWVTFDARELHELTTRTPEWREARRSKRASRVTGNKSEAFTASIVTRNHVSSRDTKPSPVGTVRTTDEIYETIRTEKGRANHAVPVAAAVELPDANLIVDPYCLGAWLGDGTSASGGLTGVDAEIWEQFEKLGYTVTHSEAVKQSHYVQGLKVQLRELGVLNNKNIPLAYARASRNQRLAMLQGLMDTDGTVTDSGKPEFTSTNERLARGVYELIVSLGWKARIIEGRAKLYGKDCGAVYNIKWSPDCSVFRLKRKRDAQVMASRRTTKFRYIIACEKIDMIPMRCITVDAADGLYLAGESMIPTHNSDLILGLARVAHTRSLLLRRIFPDLERSLISRSLEFYGPAAKYNGGRHVWHIDGRRIEFGHMSRIGTALQPKDEAGYASAPYDLIAFDQLEQFTQYGYEFMTSRLRSTKPGQRVRIVSTANPVGEGIEWIIQKWAAWLDETHPNPAKSGELRWYKRVDGGGREIETTSDDPDGLSRTFIAAGLKDNPYLGDDYRKTLNLLPEPLRSALLNGDWKASITDDAYQVVPRSWVKAAQARWQPRVNKGELRAIGADIAHGGADKTVFADLYDNWIDELRKHPGYTTPDGQAVVTLIVNMLNGRDVPVNMDVIGVGASAYDIGKDKFNAISVNFSERSDATDKSGTLRFTGIKAELYWRLREALDPNTGTGLALPPDPELLGDIVAHRWSMQTNGIRIEGKEDIKERIGRSPDCSDAVVLALYAGHQPSMSEWTKALRRRAEREREN